MLSKIKSLLLRSSRSFELWTLLLLALASWQSSASVLLYASEPDIWDEPAIYIQQGLKIAQNLGNLVNSSAIEGPLYSIWYALLSFFESDPFHLYYLNGRVLCFLLPFALYVVCRSMKMGSLASALSALSLLLFPPFLTINRWNNHFLLLVLLLGFSLIVRIQNRLHFAASFVALNVVAGFIRPELQVGVLISIGFLAFTLARGFRWREKYAIASVSGALIAFAFFAKKFWFKGSRSFNKDKFVFFDYTARRYSEQWGFLTWEEVVTKLYGPNVESPIQAFFANPAEMLKHITFYGSMGLFSLREMLSTYNYLLETLFGACLLIVLGILAVSLFVYRKTDLKLLGEKTPWPRRFLFLAAVLVLPVFAVVSLYGSVPRYLLACVVALFPLLWCFVRREGKPLATALMAATCLLCFIAPVDYGANAKARLFFGPDNGTYYGQHSLRATVLAFRAIRLREPRVTLTVNYPGQVFIDGDYQVGPCWNPTDPCYSLDWEKRPTLQKILDELRVNELLLDSDFRVLLDGRLKNPVLRDELLQFISNPNDFSFMRVNVPCSPNVIFVRKTSLHPELSPENLETHVTQAVRRESHCH